MSVADDERGALRAGLGVTSWDAWPNYGKAVLGLQGCYWYPVMWSRQLTSRPAPVQMLGHRLVLIRDSGIAYALRDRCPHRGVPLSLGSQEFPGTISCPYHGWTYDLKSGRLCAVITDGPDSPVCGKVTVQTFCTAERLGLVWIFIGPGDQPLEALANPPPIEAAIPVELIEHDFAMGGNIETRRGGWRFGAENGFDEGHAKYLHRTSLWRLLKLMPTWSKTRVIDERGGWITRVQTEVHWEADFPGLGPWSGKRWYRQGARAQVLGSSPSTAAHANPVIASLNVPGNQSIRLPGLLRIVHAKFIHYEWYVPIDADNFRYVQVMVRFETGARGTLAKLQYLGFDRWLFHGQFSKQDAWMVDVMDAPPERLYRPDVSITSWRRLCESAPADGLRGLLQRTKDSPDSCADAESAGSGVARMIDD
jgi:phenylpropionate dioxygenase-like ring-hydroxylating dioxygenase large terminal subunit